ncbi:hypothetical protein Taro_026159 [Colocasia esculenta]|uniref:Uncharacterized protein n=1 Tax=Colocasia esculenta TaxID=4460 RepID=A0A843VGB7_COLES|nr:hypothetical protein [Colocasia esculenta]
MGKKEAVGLHTLPSRYPPGSHTHRIFIKSKFRFLLRSRDPTAKATSPPSLLPVSLSFCSLVNPVPDVNPAPAPSYANAANTLAPHRQCLRPAHLCLRQQQPHRLRQLQRQSPPSPLLAPALALASCTLAGLRPHCTDAATTSAPGPAHPPPRAVASPAADSVQSPDSAAPSPRPAQGHHSAAAL